MNNQQWLSTEYREMLSVVEEFGITIKSDESLIYFDELPWLKHPELFTAKNSMYADSFALALYPDLEVISVCTWSKSNTEGQLDMAIDDFVDKRCACCLFPNVYAISSAGCLRYELTRIKKMTQAFETIIMTPKLISLFRTLDDKGGDVTDETKSKIRQSIKERLLISGD